MKEQSNENIISSKEIREMIKKEPSKPEPTQPVDKHDKAKEALESRRKAYKRRTSIYKKIMWLFLLTLLVALGVVLYWANSVWESRITGEEYLFGECTVSLGDDHITGRRKFIRPYTEILGFRYTSRVEAFETIYLENHHPDAIVVTMDGDDSYVVIFDDTQGVDVEIPVGDRYLFVLGEESRVISHKLLCH